MAFWNVVGKVAKTVAKVGLGVVGGVTGIDINSAVGLTNNNPSSAGSVTSTPTIAMPNPVVTQQSSTSWLDALKALPGAAVNFLQGTTHAQVDVNTGVGGRQGDPTNSGLPSWLLPAGLAAGGIFLVSSLTKSKRY